MLGQGCFPETHCFNLPHLRELSGRVLGFSFRVVNFVYTDLRIFYCYIPSCCISLYTLNYVEHGEHETKVLQTKVL